MADKSEQQYLSKRRQMIGSPLQFTNLRTKKRSLSGDEEPSEEFTSKKSVRNSRAKRALLLSLNEAVDKKIQDKNVSASSIQSTQSSVTKKLQAIPNTEGKDKSEQWENDPVYQGMKFMGCEHQYTSVDYARFLERK